VSHTYEKPGNYFPVVAVKDDGGLNDRDSIRIAVGGLSTIPREHDFGDVEIRRPKKTIITVGNPWYTGKNIVLKNVRLSGSEDFSITSIMDVPKLIPPHGSIELELSFTPSGWGYFLATLEIETNDSYVPLVKVPLGGSSVFHEAPPHVQIIAIQNYLDERTATGDISGSSSDIFHGVNQVKALMGMLDSVGDLMMDGEYDRANVQLESIYQVIDGEPNPPDMVTGPDVHKLTQMVGLLLQALTRI
jgi:hypothetical protein